MLIVQLSDPHVRPEGVLYQDVVDSNAMFAAVIAHVNALDPRPDLALLSGDLVDEGTYSRQFSGVDCAPALAATLSEALRATGLPE